MKFTELHRQMKAAMAEQKKDGHNVERYKLGPIDMAELRDGDILLFNFDHVNRTVRIIK